LQEQAKEINELLQQKAYFYVCGDAANMAREVNQVLVKIIAEQRGIPEAKAEEIVKSMRSANQYQVRFPLFHRPSTILFPSQHLLTRLPTTGGRLVISV
jgi:NADPH-ferrihemoprotein reductase